MPTKVLLSNLIFCGRMWPRLNVYKLHYLIMMHGLEKHRNLNIQCLYICVMTREESCIHGYYLYQNIWTTAGYIIIFYLALNSIVICMQHLFWKMMLLWAIYQNSCNGFCYVYATINWKRIFCRSATGSTFQWQARRNQQVKCLLSHKAMSVTSKIKFAFECHVSLNE